MKDLTWTPVSTSLPDKRGVYIVWVLYGQAEDEIEAYFDGFMFDNMHTGKQLNVTHWRPRILLGKPE